MHKSSLRKLAILLPGMAAMAVCWALPALAVSEADVEAAVASQGKEVVSGNLFVWFLCAIAFLKVSTKLDSILQAMGLGVGRAPGSILAEGGRSAAAGAGATSAFSGGLAGMVSSKLETDTAASMSGSGGGVTSGIGASLYKSTLGQDGGFASRVIGSVATGQTPGAIHGAAAEEAMQGYFAGTPDPAPSQGSADTAVDFSADGVGSIPSSADGTVLDDVDTDMPTDAPIPTSPLALEGDTAVPVSPGYEEEVAQAAGRASAGYTASVGSGPSASGGTVSSATIPTSSSLQQAALQRVALGQMGNRTTDVEIGGGKITGREIIPGRGQIQFAMYNAKQFERPSSHYTVQTSRDGEQWYKVYATSAVERTPTTKDERGHYQYEERKVAVLPKAPARRQNRGG
ncbi:hypothetical protein [uncultured Subdoligranulum sp.]|uniref:hypothetical protein n=1 Tax=uncultured Subdoligranulum sp. TaxID=512298 RepID=UPI0025CDA0A2|nr:hypothetical protein [uncultured Subdoligranulum sp.]